MDWIDKSDKGDEYFRCNVCLKDLKGGIAEVRKHAEGNTHIKLENGKEIQSTIESCIQKSSRSVSLAEQVKSGEIRIGMFLAENNIPIAVSDNFVELLKSIDSKSEVLKRIQCNRTKTTAIIQNVIGKYSQEEMIRIAKENIFSLLRSIS